MPNGATSIETRQLIRLDFDFRDSGIDSLIDNPFSVESGYIAVSSGCGLGIQLDRDALSRYTKRTVAIGLH